MFKLFKRVAIVAFKTSSTTTRSISIRSLSRMPQYAYPPTRRDLTISDNFHGVTVREHNTKISDQIFFLT